MPSAKENFIQLIQTGLSVTPAGGLISPLQWRLVCIRVLARAQLLPGDVLPDTPLVDEANAFILWSIRIDKEKYKLHYLVPEEPRPAWIPDGLNLLEEVDA